MKKLLCIILALAMICTLFAGCASKSNEEPAAETVAEAEQPAETAEEAAEEPAEEPAEEADPDEQHSVGFVMLGMGNEFFEAIVAAYHEAFEAIGWRHEFFSGDFDNAKIVEGIENFTAMDMDVIIVFALSGDAIASAVEQARAAGSKVICMVEHPGDNWDGLLSSDNVVTGKANAWMCAQWVEENYPDAEPGSIPVALIQLFDTVTDTQQSEGLEYITEYTDKVYVASQYEITGQNMSDGLEAAENLYTTNPEIKLFVTTSNAVSLGINSFYTALNSPVDDLSDYGTWGTNASEEALMAVAASAENGSMVRGINIQAGIDETIRCFLYLAQGLVDGTVEHEDIPASIYLVTAENVGQYFEEGSVDLQWDFELDAGAIKE